jgi:drug/metabolite transporter (DMT)-like permease
VELESSPVVGIALATASAAVLAGGSLLHRQGVRALHERRASGGAPKRLDAARSYPWTVGALLFVVAILLQMASLTFAPLVVVQPIGILALVLTVLLTDLVGGRRPSPATVRGIVTCVLGVVAFVAVAAAVSVQHPITDGQLVGVLVAFAGVLAVAALAGWSRDAPVPPIVWVVLGGVVSAFVATFGKAIILRVQTARPMHAFALDLTNVLTIGCIVGIGVAAVLSISLAQRAHAVGRQHAVVAGLAVVDATAAVVLGGALLGEAGDAPGWSVAVCLVAGGLAVSGVRQIARARHAPRAGALRGSRS